MRKNIDKTNLSALSNIFPIGAICNLDTFRIITGLNNTKEFIAENQRSNINSFRAILNDGNSFYRVCMLGYLESCILNKNVFELKKFIFDSFETILNPLRRKNCIINKHEFLGILQIILELVEANNSQLAYSYLIKAYYAYDWFDKVFTLFIKM